MNAQRIVSLWRGKRHARVATAMLTCNGAENIVPAALVFGGQSKLPWKDLLELHEGDVVSACEMESPEKSAGRCMHFRMVGQRGVHHLTKTPRTTMFGSCSFWIPMEPCTAPAASLSCWATRMYSFSSAPPSLTHKYQPIDHGYGKTLKNMFREERRQVAGRQAA